MIRILNRNADGHLQTDVPLSELGNLLEDARSAVWVDLFAEPAELCEPILKTTFRFHPLAVDDALRWSHVPRLDDWDAYVYVVLHSAILQRNGAEVELAELDIFLGRNYLVTHHDKPMPAVDAVWTRSQQDDRLLRSGPDRLLHAIADAMVMEYIPIIEQIDDEIDKIENEIFDHPSPKTLATLFDLKRAVIYMRRTIGPQREVFNRLARDEFDVVMPKSRVYFRDIYDHLVRLHDSTESMRDLVSGAVDTYLSVVNNRLGDVMKTLTIITTLFMPISFLASFFGMNFFQPSVPLHSWTSHISLYATLGVMLLVPLAMYFWVRRRGWT